jgi:DNA-binding MarR family transcriptional regulator
MSDLQHELQQHRPFESAEVEAFLALQRTTEQLSGELAELLKGSQLTPPQYNALRILRGAGQAGLHCTAIRDRMVTRESDITRLLDRLERQGLVTRWRSQDDRRVVRARITESGLAQLAALDRPVAEFCRRRVGRLGLARVQNLIATLAELREA